MLKNIKKSQIYTLQRIVTTTAEAIMDNTHTAPARSMRRSMAMRLGSVSGLSVILISSRASIRFGNLLIILYAVIYCGLFNTPLLYINIAM